MGKSKEEPDIKSGDTVADAKLSDCGKYRYELSRIWEPTDYHVCWIMLNPSTADARKDDPTIRRCKAFTKRAGFSRMLVVNLFAFRATDPKRLLDVRDPVGGNLYHLESALETSEMVVAAWGALSRKLELLASPSLSIIRGSKAPLKCLGRTKDGHPRHPLYVKSYTPLEDLTL